MLDWVAEKRAENEYYLLRFHLDPIMFSFIIQQPRLWMPAIPWEKLHGKKEAAADAILMTAMDACLRVGAKDLVTLSHLMLPPGHHNILSYMDFCRQLKLVKYTPPPKRSAQTSKKYVPWPESHARFYEAKGNGHGWVSSSRIPSVALQERFPPVEQRTPGSS